MNKKIFAAAFLAALSIPAFADDSGYYLGLDYIQMNLGNLTTVEGAGASQPTNGYRIDGGYNFNKNWGVEIGYYGSGNASGASGNSITPNSSYVAGVGTYPINEMFDVFGKLGVAMNQMSDSNGCTVCGVQTGLMYGAGLDYNFDKNATVRLQYENLGNIMGTDPVSGSQITASDVALGVIYKF